SRNPRNKGRPAQCRAGEAREQLLDDHLRLDAGQGGEPGLAEEGQCPGCRRPCCAPAEPEEGADETYATAHCRKPAGAREWGQKWGQRWLSDPNVSTMQMRCSRSGCADHIDSCNVIATDPQ